MTRTDIVKKLNDRLLSKAMEAEADCLVTGCTMCQANLDTRQEEYHVAAPQRVDSENGVAHQPIEARAHACSSSLPLTDRSHK